jgi:hypothetical protein
MKKANKEMLAEYDFSKKKGIRGKYHKAYERGHSVRIYSGKRLVSDEFFAAIEPELRSHFPNSKAVNNALRKFMVLSSAKPISVRK